MTPSEDRVLNKLREEIARIVDARAWELRDRIVAAPDRAALNRGRRAVDMPDEDGLIADSLAKADQIIAAWNRRADPLVEELRGALLFAMAEYDPAGIDDAFAPAREALALPVGGGSACTNLGGEEPDGSFAGEAQRKSEGERLHACWQAVLLPRTATGEHVAWDDFDAEQQSIWDAAARRYAAEGIRAAFRAGWYVNAAVEDQSPEYLAACEEVDWRDHFAALSSGVQPVGSERSDDERSVHAAPIPSPETPESGDDLRRDRDAWKADAKHYISRCGEQQEALETAEQALSASQKEVERLTRAGDVAWLIEWPADRQMPVRYWHPTEGHVIDPNHAVRFCRREDAEAMLKRDHLFGGARPVEHMWLPAREALALPVGGGSAREPALSDDGGDECSLATETPALRLVCEKCGRSIDYDRSIDPGIPGWVATLSQSHCDADDCDTGDRLIETWLDADGVARDPAESGADSPSEASASALATDEPHPDTSRHVDGAVLPALAFPHTGED